MNFLSFNDFFSFLSGETHPGTLLTMTNLAIFYDQNQQFARAEELYKKVLDIRQNQLGTCIYNILYVCICDPADRFQRIDPAD